jgi:hypothetical protein
MKSKFSLKIDNDLHNFWSSLDHLQPTGPLKIGALYIASAALQTDGARWAEICPAGRAKMQRVRGR